MSIYPTSTSTSAKPKFLPQDVVPIFDDKAFDYNEALTDLKKQIGEKFFGECIKNNKNYYILTPKEKYEYIDSCGATKQ